MSDQEKVYKKLIFIQKKITFLRIYLQKNYHTNRGTGQKCRQPSLLANAEKLLNEIC